MTQEQKVIENRLGLLESARQLGRVPHHLWWENLWCLITQSVRRSTIVTMIP